MGDNNNIKFFQKSNTIAMYVLTILGLVYIYFFMGVLMMAFQTTSYDTFIFLGIITILFGYLWHWIYPKNVRNGDYSKNSYHQYMLEMSKKRILGEKIIISDRFILWVESKGVVRLFNFVGFIVILIGVIALILK